MKKKEKKKKREKDNSRTIKDYSSKQNHGTLYGTMKWIDEKK